MPSKKTLADTNGAVDTAPTSQPVGSQEPTTMVTEDGYVVDASSGEIVGRVDLPKEQWEPAEESEFEWILGKYGEEVALESRFKERAKAMADEQRSRRRRADWWVKRFDPFLRKFVVANAEKGKKSVKLANGTIQLRSVGDKFSVIDDDAAVELAKSIGLQKLVVVKEVVADKDSLIAQATLDLGILQATVSEYEKIKSQGGAIPAGIEREYQDAQRSLDLIQKAIAHTPAHESLSLNVGVKK